MTKTSIPDILGKKVLIDRLSDKCDIYQEDARRILDGLIEILEETVENEKQFKVGGLGSILYSPVPARETSNFGKGTVVLPATMKVLFKLSPKITELIK